MVGKNSFRLYTEWIEIFEELSNEDAGQLIKHIFQYVNDQDPVTENQLVKLSFIQIKQQLKRDLKKWEKRCITNRANGELGGRPKKPSETNRLIRKPRKPDKDKDKDKVEDKEKEKEKRKRDLVLPFDSNIFLKSWELWKRYKKDEHKFKYVSPDSEQAALTKLKNLSNDQENDAIKILNESIANGWQGFFELDKPARQRTNRPSNIHRNKTKSKYNF